MNNEAQNAIGDAIKVLYFMVQNNLPLDVFKFSGFNSRTWW